MMNLKIINRQRAPGPIGDNPPLRSPWHKVLAVLCQGRPAILTLARHDSGTLGRFAESPVYEATPHKMGLDTASTPQKPGSPGAAL
jgi:hypothetical protein